MKLIPTLELPPEAGDIDISMFKDAFGKIPATVKLGTLLEAVASGRWRDQVQDLRNLLHSGNRETYDARKRLLPAVTLSGLFRDRTELVQHSGLLQGDFDKLQNPEEIRNALGKDQYIIASFLSPSTEGVKAVVWVPADPGRHIEIFKAAERYFKECYGLEMDQSCKETNRLCFVSLDPQIRTNSAATVLDMKRWAPSREEKTKSQTGWIPPGNNPPGGERLIRWGSTDWRAVFESAGMLLGLQGSRINVLCPFRESHTTNRDGGCYLFRGKEGSWGWTCQHSHCQHRTLKDVAESLWEHVLTHSEPFEPEIQKVQNKICQVNQDIPLDWSIPSPLPDHHQLPPKLDPEILPEPLAEFCHSASLENETAPEAATVFILAGLGILTGTRFAINPDPLKPTWFEYAVRSVVLVMPVSSNKTAVFRAGLNPLDQIQIKKDAEFRANFKDFEGEQNIFQARRKSLLRKLESPKLDSEKRRATEGELRDLDSIAPLPPDRQVLITNRATPEKILQLAGSGSGRGILLKSDELLGLLSLTERRGNEGLREFYAESMTVARHFSGHTIGRGTDYAETLALSIAGCVQPRKLRRLLSEMEQGFKDDGLLQRFLWIWPDPPSFESFEEESRKESGISSTLFQRVQFLFEKIEGLTPEVIGAEKTEFAPAPWVGFDREAQEIWWNWRRELRKNLIHEEGIPEGYSAWLAKSERLVSGLALTFHCVECVERRAPGPVGRTELERAIRLWDVLRYHAHRVFGLNQTGDLEAVHLLAARLGKLEPEFSLRDLKQKNWKGLRDNEVLKEALDWLIELGYLRELKPMGKPQGGRPSSRLFAVNPKTFEDS